MITVNKRLTSMSVMVMLLLGVLSGCAGNDNDLVGTWIPEVEMSSDYPEEYIAFQEDGTGRADGLAMDWYVNDERLYITVSSVFGKESYDYDFEVSGSTLVLDGFSYKKTE